MVVAILLMFAFSYQVGFAKVYLSIYPPYYSYSRTLVIADVIACSIIKPVSYNMVIKFSKSSQRFFRLSMLFSHRFTHGIPCPSGRYYIDTIAMPLNRLIWILKNSNLGIIKVSIAFVLSPFGWYAYNIPPQVILVNPFFKLFF